MHQYTLQKSIPPLNFKKQKPTFYKPNQQTIYFLNLPYEISIQIDYYKRKNRMNERIKDLEKKVQFLDMICDFDGEWFATNFWTSYCYVYNELENIRVFEINFNKDEDQVNIDYFYY